MELNYKIDVEKALFRGGGRKVLKPGKRLLQRRYGLDLSNTPDVKKGDKFSIKKNADEVAFFIMVNF